MPKLKHLKTIISASIEAGKEILKVYRTSFNVEYKEDNSPLTMADKNAHNVIISFLNDTTIPILSEEGSYISYEERKNWSLLWVVDPLDGTKEFVKRNDEFTVNIALVENGIPVMGVVYAPVLDLLYVGAESLGAYRIKNASTIDNITGELINENRLPLSTTQHYFGVVASRSHLNEETELFIDKLRKQHEDIKIVSIGSSLKLCMVAEGAADIYPRFAPTMEWDTAAGDAVVRASGGKTLIANTKNNLQYNKENLLNPWFIVSR
ncbi:MAG TPA: 3'(2'),5'-bisphosphate nucleotidase CysQ [Bacteroidales bacterium]|nr:3'(2'),5'-bisphosphate nucleotidase CysQ [Bacteroidales bacterium]